MFGLRAQADRIRSRPHEIAQRFVVGGRDVDRGELLGAMETCQSLAIVPVGFDPVATALRHTRRIHDDAVLTLGREVPVDPKPTRPALVDEAEPTVRRLHRAHHLGQRLQVAGNHAVVAHLAVAPSPPDTK